MSLLSLEHVSRSFGKLAALADVTFAADTGELRAVIGPNGAGKTTLFNLISGLFPPSRGEILFDGRPIHALKPERRVALGIVRTFQITEIFNELTVYENVRVGVETAARITRRPWIDSARAAAIDRRVNELLGITGLAAKADRIVSELAHGDQRVVEVAIALSLQPKLLLLDEPTAGMADEETEDMVRLIRRLHTEQELGIVFIEHDRDIVFGIAERVTVLDQGRILADGPPAAIAADPKVRAAYLGEAA